MKERMHKAGRRWAPEIAVALVSACFVAYLIVAPGTPRSVNVVDNLVQLVVPAITTVLALRAAHRAGAAHSPTGAGQGDGPRHRHEEADGQWRRLRSSWLLIALATGSWTVGQAVWCWYEVVRDVPVPNPSWADAGFLGMIPLLLVGLVRYPVPGLLPLARLRLALDSVIIGAGLLFVAQSTVLEAAMEKGGTVAARAVAITYPLGGVAALAVVGALLIRRHEGWRGPLPRVVIGLVGLVVSDLAYVQLTALGELGDHPVNAGWPIGFAVIGLAALRVRPDTSTAGELRDRGQLTPARVEGIVPALPVGAAAVLVVVHGATGDPLGPLLGITGAVLLVGLAARLLFAQLENQELTGDLRTTVAELRDREDELHHRAFHDPLTGLANRDLLRDRLEHALMRRRHDPVSIVFLDLDEFKGVNDSLGHDAGDQLLVLVAERLRGCVRAGDTVARLGGDEFSVLVEDDDGSAVAHRILGALVEPFTVLGRQLRIGASIGIAVGLPGATTASQLLQDADLAMYAAKSGGKGRAAMFEPFMRKGAIDRLDLLHDLDTALERGELLLHYQAVHRLRPASKQPIGGYEALLRWQHPDRGLLAPQTFIELAEETGRIVPIGWWVLEQACRSQMQFRTVTGGDRVQVAVNLSARQVIDPMAPQALAHALAVSGADPADVLLEVPESALLEGDETLAAMRALRDMGVRIVIDDFGGGRASLQHLSVVPVDVVKIDPSLVARLDVEPGPDDLLVKAVVEVAQGRGLRTVAEGVEHAWQLARLAELGCDAAQGYLLGPPQPLPEVLATLGRRGRASAHGTDHDPGPAPPTPLAIDVTDAPPSPASDDSERQA